MAVLSQPARVLYVVIPKAACTSIKAMFLELAGDDAPRRGLAARLLRRPAPPLQRSVHQIDGYRTLPFAEVATPPAGFAKITLVRDPIARLQSAWANKVCAAAFDARGETEAVRARGLPLDPSFAAFLENHAAYREISAPARIHTRPLAWHLGPDLGWYDQVFRLEDMPAFEAYVGARAGRPVAVPRENRSDAAGRPLDFEARHVDLMRDLLAEDYRLLGALYHFDDGLETFRRRNGLALSAAS